MHLNFRDKCIFYSVLIEYLKVRNIGTELLVSVKFVQFFNHRTSLGDKTLRWK